MKLSDIIDFEQSFWQVLGQKGGTALPDNDKSVNVDGIDIWKKDPPFRKNNKRTNEAFGGQQSVTPHYDIAKHPDIKKIRGNPEPSNKEPTEYDNWATPPKDGKSYMVVDQSGRRRKIMIRKVGRDTEEAMDDEGNRFIVNKTGPIDHKKMHTGKSASAIGEPGVSEGSSGVGPGGLGGATMHAGSGPAELEYDLTKVDDEFKGKDTRAEIKTNKKKRETLKQFLSKRTDREIV